MAIVRIISLGEIVTQNQRKALAAFAALINPATPEAVMGGLGKILQTDETKYALDQFKLGLKSEDEFTGEMISKIKEATGVELTRANFDRAWNAMNSSFSEFIPLLSDVIREHRDGQKMVFVSYTNPIDIEHLIRELDTNGLDYTTDGANGQLNSIGGVPLYLTYSERKSKVDLILQIISQMTEPAPAVASSASFFSTESPLPTDVKYIRSIQGEMDPLLKSLRERSDREVRVATESAGIETLFWNKQDGQAFSSVIHSTAVHVVPVAGL